MMGNIKICFFCLKISENVMKILFEPATQFPLSLASPRRQTKKKKQQFTSLSLSLSRKNNNNERCTQRMEMWEKEKSVTNHDDFESWQQQHEEIIQFLLILTFSSGILKLVPAAAREELIWVLLCSRLYRSPRGMLRASAFSILLDRPMANRSTFLVEHVMGSLKRIEERVRGSNTCPKEWFVIFFFYSHFFFDLFTKL